MSADSLQKVTYSGHKGKGYGLEYRYLPPAHHPRGGDPLGAGYVTCLTGSRSGRSDRTRMGRAAMPSKTSRRGTELLKPGGGVGAGELAQGHMGYEVCPAGHPQGVRA